MDLLDSCFSLYHNEVLLFSGDLTLILVCLLVPFLAHQMNKELFLIDTYPNGVMSQSQFLPQDLSTACIYISDAPSSSSFIDHIICPESFVPRFASCSIDLDHPLNVSDHFPVLAKFGLKPPADVLPSHQSNVTNKYSSNWRKCTQSNLAYYHCAVVSSLPPIPRH